MRKKNVFYLVITAVFMAVTLILVLVPNVGFIQIPPVSITIVHIPILIGIVILPIWHGAALGLTFGLGSLFAAYTQASTPIDLAFQNPLVSVLPRIIFALVAFFIFHGIRLLVKHVKYGETISFGLVSLLSLTVIVFGLENFSDEYNWSSELYLGLVILVSGIIITLYFLANNKNNKTYSAVSSAFIISTICHTLLVLGSLAVFKVDVFGNDSVKDLIMAVVMSNGMIEAFLAALIGTPVYLAISKRFPDLANENLFLKNERN